MANKSTATKNAQRRHHFKASKRHVTAKADYPTAINKAAKILDLTDNQLAIKFNGRVTAGTIRAWRNGARTTPQWALTILYESLSKYVAETHAALVAIEQAKAKNKAGESASLQEWIQKSF